MQRGRFFEVNRLLFFQPCYVYLFSKYRPAVSPGGWRQWGAFVIRGHWSAVPQLLDVWLGLIECTAAEMLSGFLFFFDCGKPTDASQLLTSRPSLCSHALPQGGWGSGQLLQWGEWVLLQVNTKSEGLLLSKPPFVAACVSFTLWFLGFIDKDFFLVEK